MIYAGPLEIVFYTEGLPFNGATPNHSALGGSESSLIYVARGLAALGHRVSVYCNCPESGEFDGVTYGSTAAFAELYVRERRECDVMIVSRFDHLIRHGTLEAKHLILWVHDICMPQTADRLQSLLWRIDKIALSTQFQADRHEERLQRGPDLYLIVPLAIDIAEARAAVARTQRLPNRLIYTSRPDRGLDTLLEIWPRIIARRPDLELAIAYYDFPAVDRDPLRPLIERIDATIAELPNIIRLGPLAKPQLFEEVARAKLLIYPTSFWETFCIAAMEAQACGTPVVSSDFCALKTTVKNGETGVLLPGDPKSEWYQEHFADEVVALLDDAERWERYSAAGKEHAAQFDIPNVARQWEAEFRAWFAAIPEDLRIHHLKRHGELDAVREFWPEESTGAEAVYSPETVINAYDALHREQPCLMGAAAMLGERRVQWIIEEICKRDEIRSVVDMGCYHAGVTVALANAKANLHVTGLEVSPEALVGARKVIEEEAERPEQVDVRQCCLPEVPNELRGTFDAAMCCEVLEHLPDLDASLAAMESLVKPGGWVFVTVPSGPWEVMGQDNLAAHPHTTPPGNRRFHVREFDRRDLEELFHERDDLRVNHLLLGTTERGELLGQWCLSYRTNEKPLGKRDLFRHACVIRPQQRVSVCMVARDCETIIGHALASVRAIADEIIVADTGSKDLTKQVCKRWGARVIDIPWTDNFAEARNRSIAEAKGEWILWIDADEWLEGSVELGQYLYRHWYDALVIPQIHLMVDGPLHDLPPRVFRNGQGIQFYGYIHEMPGRGLNEPIADQFVPPGVRILHTGYATLAMRTARTDRNWEIIQRELQECPDRDFIFYYWAREIVRLASLELARTFTLTAETRRDLEAVLTVHNNRLKDSLPTIAQLGVGVEQEALRLLGDRGLECEYAITMQGSNLTAAAGQPHRRRFQTRDDCRRFFAAEVDKALAALTPFDEAGQYEFDPIPMGTPEPVEAT